MYTKELDFAKELAYNAGKIMLTHFMNTKKSSRLKSDDSPAVSYTHLDVYKRQTSYGSAVVRQFEMMRVYTSVSSLALVRSRDKFRALQLLARSGVGIPRTVFARQSQEPDSLIDVVGGSPVVIKLLEGTHGIGAVSYTHLN